MAEEDLLFGKNRHLFGGIEPSNMQAFQVTSNYDIATAKAKVKILGKMPADTIIDGQTLCSVLGVVIRKSTVNYPQNEFDGDLVDDIKTIFGVNDPLSFKIYDENVVLGTTYYYSAFPYTTQGVYNRNTANRAVITAATHSYLYGYDLTIADTNPATRVTYPTGVDNTSYVAAGMNFTTSIFSYGNWPVTPGEDFMPKPCMLNYDGEVIEYLNPNDYTKKIDGTNSRVADITFHGNAMMEWPKIYTQRKLENGVYKFRCSDVPLGDDWDCWSNYDRNNNEIDHFYTPIYFGSSIGNVLRSISGQANYVSNTRASEIALAKANGEDWYTEVVSDRLLIQDLLVMMAKSTETQSKFGYGRCASGNTTAIGQGTMNTKGLFWGSNDQASGVKVFGMENWWGNLWRACAGWINANGVQKMKFTRGTKDGSIATDYNIDGTGYLTIASATPSGASGGYISTMKNDLPYGRIPYIASGSSSTNETDGLWFNNGQVDYAFVGGSWAYALLVGAFYANLNAAASHADAGNGAAISCKPLAV